MKACLSDLNSSYVFAPAHKARSNITIICERYHIMTLIKELGLDNCSIPTGNSAYTLCQMSSEDIVNIHDLDKLIKKGNGKLARKFNLSYCYINDLICFNNNNFKEFISDIYPQKTYNFWNQRIYFSCILPRSAFHPRQKQQFKNQII